MDGFKRPPSNHGPKPTSDVPNVHHSQPRPPGDVNVTVHNHTTPPVIKTGVLERNWLTALLLAIFLGGLGIDQFYLGKTGKGILKFFTGGLFGILWIIDIIMIATKSVNHIVWTEKEQSHAPASDPHTSGNWFANHKVMTAILGFIILIVIISVATGGGNKTAKISTTAAIKPAPQTQQAAPKTTTTPAPTKSTPTPKVASRQVKGTATTLGAGTFTGGKDVPVGLYDVTTTSGQSGNFIVSGTDSYNEVLGVSDGFGVPKVRAQISTGDQVEISGLSQVVFTPVTAPFVTTQTVTSLYAGTFTVGQDIGAGRYTATTTAGSSGNFIVSGADSVNEVLGVSDGFGVPSVTTNLKNGDIVEISGLSQVTLTPTT